MSLFSRRFLHFRERDCCHNSTSFCIRNTRSVSGCGMATPAGPKPIRPSADFPLFLHAAGVWAKKSTGRMHDFGPWGDPDGALAKYRREVDDLQAGLTPRPGVDNGVTLRNAVNHFVESKSPAAPLTKTPLSDGRHLATAPAGITPANCCRVRRATLQSATVCGYAGIVEIEVRTDFMN